MISNSRFTFSLSFIFFTLLLLILFIYVKKINSSSIVIINNWNCTNPLTPKICSLACDNNFTINYGNASNLNQTYSSLSPLYGGPDFSNAYIVCQIYNSATNIVYAQWYYPPSFPVFTYTNLTFCAGFIINNNLTCYLPNQVVTSFSCCSNETLTENYYAWIEVTSIHSSQLLSIACNPPQICNSSCNSTLLINYGNSSNSNETYRSHSPSNLGPSFSNAYIICQIYNSVTNVVSAQWYYPPGFAASTYANLTYCGGLMSSDGKNCTMFSTNITNFVCCSNQTLTNTYSIWIEVSSIPVSQLLNISCNPPPSLCAAGCYSNISITYGSSSTINQNYAALSNPSTVMWSDATITCQVYNNVTNIVYGQWLFPKSYPALTYTNVTYCNGIISPFGAGQYCNTTINPVTNFLCCGFPTISESYTPYIVFNPDAVDQPVTLSCTNPTLCSSSCFNNISIPLVLNQTYYVISNSTTPSDQPITCQLYNNVSNVIFAQFTLPISTGAYVYATVNYCAGTGNPNSCQLTNQNVTSFKCCSNSVVNETTFIGIDYNNSTIYYNELQCFYPTPPNKCNIGCVNSITTTSSDSYSLLTSSATFSDIAINCQIYNNVSNIVYASWLIPAGTKTLTYANLSYCEGIQSLNNQSCNLTSLVTITNMICCSNYTRSESTSLTIVLAPSAKSYGITLNCVQPGACSGSCTTFNSITTSSNYLYNCSVVSDTINGPISLEIGNSITIIDYIRFTVPANSVAGTIATLNYCNGTYVNNACQLTTQVINGAYACTNYTGSAVINCYYGSTFTQLNLSC